VSLLVKICGVTREADVAAAVEAGADAIGFVFHESSRRNVAPSRAAELASALPADILRVAVTLHPTRRLVRKILAEFGPNVWQSDHEDFGVMGIPPEIQRWPVLRTGRRAPTELPHMILFDAAVSGNGLQADWATAALLARRSLLIIGGGLKPETVAHAVEAIRPVGVDVSSGVEREPGIKDGALVRQFVAAARAADRSANS